MKELNEILEGLDPSEIATWVAKNIPLAETLDAYDQETTRYLPADVIAPYVDKGEMFYEISEDINDGDLFDAIYENEIRDLFDDDDIIEVAKQLMPKEVREIIHQPAKYWKETLCDFFDMAHTVSNEDVVNALMGLLK